MRKCPGDVRSWVQKRKSAEVRGASAYNSKTDLSRTPQLIGFVTKGDLRATGRLGSIQCSKSDLRTALLLLDYAQRSRGMLCAMNAGGFLLGLNTTDENTIV
jgi:hypothetical protein